VWSVPPTLPCRSQITLPSPDSPLEFCLITAQGRATTRSLVAASVRYSLGPGSLSSGLDSPESHSSHLHSFEIFERDSRKRRETTTTMMMT
jgi:hypothetical protein